VDGALIRASRWLIGLIIVAELLILPWTAHAFDVAAFLSHSDRVFFGHVWLTALWPFGGIALLAVLLSQLPVLLFPRLWSAVPLRIFLLKLPPWIADLGTAAIVRFSCSQGGNANLWALRYLSDPAVFFVTVFHGQNDALANVFAVAGIALTLAGRYEFAGLALGFGAGTKLYPAAFVPLLLAVAFRRESLRTALVTFACFAAAAVSTLLPVVWGRFGFFVGSYANNSFGAARTNVSTASLWSLLTPVHVSFSPQSEQLVAVVIPVLLAALELRHVPQRRDIARAAMLTAVSIVLLNPGAHPPFYLWIAGPLVLYAAVTEDGVASFAGAVLSVLSIAMQFCQEGSDEYFTLNFGRGSSPQLLACVAPHAVLQLAALACVAVIVAASYGHTRISARLMRSGRLAGLVVALLACVFLTVSIGTTIASRGFDRARDISGYRSELRLLNTFGINPIAQRLGNGRCLLTYAAYDNIVFAGNPFAARYATASFGYTLVSAEKMIVRGRLVALEALPSTFENFDIRAGDEKPVRITREFDVSALLRPFRYVERVVEQPCNLIRANPLLIYRFDIEAAHEATAQKPLVERLDVFARIP
jgi:hypothetical protein